LDKIEIVVVPLDFSPYSKHGLRAAMTLARLTGAKVHLIHVIPEGGGGQSAFHIPLPAVSELEKTAHEWAEKAYRDYLQGEATEGLEIHRELRFGRPDQGVTAYADEVGADLIVLASHGRSGFERAVFGSVAEKVLRLARQPVLMVKGG